MSTTKYTDLLKSLGFDGDPFAKTNADEEERLEEYFVAPPFYNAVFGDLSTPGPALVFAPRGGGKTALKRKIELSSQPGEFLCLSYNHFDVAGKRLSDIDSAYHLRNLVEMLLVAIIAATTDRGIQCLSNEDRHLIYLLVKEHLSKIDQSRLKSSIKGIKNLSDAGKEFWNKFTGPIGLVVNALLTKWGLGNAEIREFEQQDGKVGNFTDQLYILQAMSKKLGFSSIYILIDRVDENALTGTADKSYKFITPLITDLQLLETAGFGFKFFLWDLLLQDYRSVARPDRVKYYSMEWQQKQLKQMLSERLKTYSNNIVGSLQQITDTALPAGLDQAVAICAQGSPRNVVRICKEILDQQSELDATAKRISSEAVQLGFDKIAENISRELFSETIIKELQKTQRCDFTIRYLYSDVFKFTQQAALNKVKSWENNGAVLQLGTIQEPKKRSSNHYGIAHILLSKHMFGKMPIGQFIERKIRECCNCGKVLLRDWDITSTQQCNFCQHENK